MPGIPRQTRRGGFLTSLLGEWSQALLLFGLFFLVAHGNSLFGLLQLASSKYLGAVSYSLYLLHGIILYVCLALLNRWHFVKDLSPMEYWLWVGVIATMLVLTCGFTYRYVEHPFLAKGRKK